MRYDTDLFLQKNTDPPRPDLLELMRRSECEFMRSLFATLPPPASAGSENIKIELAVAATVVGGSGIGAGAGAEGGAIHGG